MVWPGKWPMFRILVDLENYGHLERTSRRMAMQKVQRICRMGTRDGPAMQKVQRICRMGTRAAGMGTKAFCKRRIRIPTPPFSKFSYLVWHDGGNDETNR